MDNNNQKQIFPGFPPEPIKNYWEYPRIMNGYWKQLSGSEQKALDYILRHTWGYKKTADYISYSQFINGIIKKTGEPLDGGCGIKSSKTLRKALVALERQEFIETIKAVGKTIFYRLKIDKNSELWEKVKRGMEESKEVGVVKSKDTIEDNTIIKKTIDPLFSSHKDKIEDYKQGKRWEEKPYFKGYEMRWNQNKWWVIENEEWKEYNAKEREIEWKG